MTDDGDLNDALSLWEPPISGSERVQLQALADRYPDVNLPGVPITMATLIGSQLKAADGEDLSMALIARTGLRRMLELFGDQRETR